MFSTISRSVNINPRSLSNIGPRHDSRIPRALKRKGIHLLTTSVLLLIAGTCLTGWSSTQEFSLVAISGPIIIAVALLMAALGLRLLFLAKKRALLLPATVSVESTPGSVGLVLLTEHPENHMSVRQPSVDFPTTPENVIIDARAWDPPQYSEAVAPSPPPYSSITHKPPPDSDEAPPFSPFTPQLPPALESNTHTQRISVCDSEPVPRRKSSTSPPSYEGVCEADASTSCTAVQLRNETTDVTSRRRTPPPPYSVWNENENCE